MMKEHINPKGRQVYKEIVLISQTQIQIVKKESLQHLSRNYVNETLKMPKQQKYYLQFLI